MLTSKFVDIRMKDDGMLDDFYAKLNDLVNSSCLFYWLHSVDKITAILVYSRNRDAVII
jgi:hypothetical protein